MAISDLNRLSATEPFPSVGFQIINEASMMDDSLVPLNQNKRMSHRWSWGVNTSVFSTQEIKATFFREFPIWVKMSVLD
jgi:hypothetical protein